MPESSIKGQRYDVKGRSALIAQVATAWKYLKALSIETPERPDKILEQLVDARLRAKELRLFSPWGPRYSSTSAQIKRGDLEIRTLKELSVIIEQLTVLGYTIDFLLMPADVYGTEINRLPQQFVQDYFTYLQEIATRMLSGKVKLTVKPWSTIRANNANRYAVLQRDFTQNFPATVKAGEFEKAVRVATIFSPDNPEDSARRYCLERLIEGVIISETFDPTKLSLVRKEKDALDGPLKRLYIVRARAPWLGEA